MNEQLTKRYIQVRRQYIANCFSQLNDMQLEAVLKTEGPLQLLAGAGSGKTTVLIQRIANILRFGNGSDSDYLPYDVSERDIEVLEALCASRSNSPEGDRLCAGRVPYPSNILAITFTNKAASELKERLCDMLGEDGNSVWAMTFHAACCRILRREIDRLGYHSDFTIYDTSDSEKIMKEVLKAKNLDEKSFPPKMLLNAISRAKERLIMPEDYAFSELSNSDYRNEVVEACYTDYQNRLRTANAVDFDDIILLTVKLLQDYPEVRDYYGNKFRYVLVDEYQDTNHAQAVLTALLAEYHGNICVVGDDDQSIYKFRGATIDNILNFEKQYPGARLIRLEQNYRSTSTILDAANAVIRNNRGRKGKELWTKNGVGEKVCIFEASNQYSEADRITDELVRIGRQGHFRDCAVLYRNNAQSNVFEQSFSRAGIPYRIIGGIRFFDRAEVKDVLAYLTVIDNPSDNLRLKRIINLPPRGIGAKTLEQAERISDSLHIPLFEVLQQAALYPALEKAAKKLSAFAELLTALQSLEKVESLPEFYDDLLKNTGYLELLNQKDLEDGKSRAENVLELRSNIVSYCEENDSPSLQGFLEEISLYTDLEQYNAAEDAVVLMTMHSAKGLEFANVFLTGLEEGLFPSARSSGDAQEIEEERRLCYVGITRAKKNLFLSFAHERMLFGRTSYNRHSRFLDEIPEQYCEYKHSPGLSGLQFGGASGFGFKRVPEQGRYQGSPFARSDGEPMRGRRVGGGAAYNKPAAAVPEYVPGNMVQHKSFGKGMVLTAVRMGGDTLLEIMFDSCGTKKLMASSASAHMVKL